MDGNHLFHSSWVYGNHSWMEPTANAVPDADRLAIAVRVEENPSDPRPAHRAKLANAVIPGAGLIMRDQSIWGLLTGLSFWLPLGGAFYGTWVSPARVPMRLTLVLTVLALASYFVSQVLLHLVLRRRDEKLASYVGATVPLLRRVYRAMTEGEWIEARMQLDKLLEVDPEHFEGNLVLARLLAIEGKCDQATEAYARCRRLAGRRWNWEIDRELGLMEN